jgi:hypothetical protein
MKALTTLLAVGMLLAPVALADDLVGAWEMTESIEADGTPRENVGGMIVFAASGHYSWISIRGTRPNYPSQAEATDVQKTAAFETFGANAGTYTASGSTLTRDPAAAKNPYVYAPGNTIVQTFQIDGRTLTLTAQSGAVQKYRRLE